MIDDWSFGVHTHTCTCTAETTKSAMHCNPKLIPQYQYALMWILAAGPKYWALAIKSSIHYLNISLPRWYLWRLIWCPSLFLTVPYCENKNHFNFKRTDISVSSIHITFPYQAEWRNINTCINMKATLQLSIYTGIVACSPKAASSTILCIQHTAIP